MTRIVRVTGRRVWDSRARPTVEADVVLEGGRMGRAIAPAGASMGSGEAIDLRDGGASLGGYDVRRAVSHVNTEISDALRGQDITDQAAIDRILIELDGTAQKSRLGGNATIAVSMAVLHAAAAAAGVPLYAHVAQGRPISIPLPEIQILGGGAHAGRRVDVQDFLVMCPSASSFAEAIDRTARGLSRGRKTAARQRARAQGVADEGGWWPAFNTNEEALDLADARHRGRRLHAGPGGAHRARYRSVRVRAGRTLQVRPEKREFDRDGLGELLLAWIDALSDPLDRGPIRRGRCRRLPPLHRGGRRKRAGGRRRLPRHRRGAWSRRPRRSACVNCVLVKPNQAGTVTEALAALRRGAAAGIATIVSARSGETEDTTIVHLAVGWNAGQIKVGSITRGERTAKWNELLRLEESLAGQATFAGWDALPISPAGAAARRNVA